MANQVSARPALSRPPAHRSRRNDYRTGVPGHVRLGLILEVQAPLVRLLSRLPGVKEIVAQGDRLPHIDLHCPLMSLPHAFGTTLDTIPAATPYTDSY